MSSTSASTIHRPARRRQPDDVGEAPHEGVQLLRPADDDADGLLEVVRDRPSEAAARRSGTSAAASSTRPTVLLTSCDIIRISFSYAALSDCRSSSVSSSSRKKLRGKPRSRKVPCAALHPPRAAQARRTRDCAWRRAPPDRDASGRSSSSRLPAADAGGVGLQQPLGRGVEPSRRGRRSRARRSRRRDLAARCARNWCCSCSRTRSSRRRSTIRL